MKLSFARFVIGPLAILLVLSFGVVPQAQGQENTALRLEQFGLVDDSSGWVLLGRELFLTTDAGASWDRVTPGVPAAASILDVAFADLRTGWVLWSTAVPGGDVRYELARTSDWGRTWNVRPLSLFQPGEMAAQAEKVEMGWLDPLSGWISVKQSSGANFSLGTLFTTADGGATWKRTQLPVAGSVHFNSPQQGWVAGGPAGDRIFETGDAGVSWQESRPGNFPAGVNLTVYPPHFSGSRGLLVATILEAGSSLRVYTAGSAAPNWTPAGQVSLESEPGRIGLSILDPSNFLSTLPGTSTLIRMREGQLDLVKNLDGMSASIVELDMTTLEDGWAKWVDADCRSASSPTDGLASVTCTSQTRLLRTADGGLTWQTVSLPLVDTELLSREFSVVEGTLATGEVSAQDNTQVFIGQGFDICEIPTLSQMQTWWDSSPYKTVNLYIGGSSRACANSVLTASYLNQLFQQGWKFIPTWVGPQAPCTGYSSRMSSDPATAYDQGVNEANLAVERLSQLGLTHPDKTGSVVYYDIEYYGTNTSCREAVNAFMDGWVTQLHARGNLAGVYGSTLCNTGLSDFLTIPNVPDVIWPARWYHNAGSGYYDPDASVWDLGSCLPNSVWAAHQRIRQYEGPHEENWGDLIIEIDSDVLDGVVAIPNLLPQVKDIIPANPNPTGASSVEFTVVFYKSVTGVDAGDFELSTTGVIGAAITGVTGSGTTYTVAVDTGSGDGTIRLDLIDDDSIKDAVDNPLGGAGAGNGDFTSGNAYEIVKGFDAGFGDNPASAQPIAGLPVLKRADTSSATASVDDPPIPACDLAPGLASVWYTFTPSENGLVYFDTFGSDYDTFIAVWSDAALTNLVACNDDDGRDGLNAALGFDAAAGTTYYIQVAQFNGLISGSSGKSIPGTPGGDLAFHATSFQDVPGNHPHWTYIEALYANELTAGCSVTPLRFCPDNVLDRAQSAVFMLRGNFGNTYAPPPPPWNLFADNWSVGAWAEKWAEGMYNAGLTAGCSAKPLRFCPWDKLPRTQVSVFGLKLMHGDSYSPPDATGTVFADVTDPGIWYAKWAEQAYADGLLPACGTDPGTGKPLFCPNQLVDRGWGSYVIVKAKDLLPSP